MHHLEYLHDAHSTSELPQPKSNSLQNFEVINGYWRRRGAPQGGGGGDRSGRDAEPSSATYTQVE